MVVGGVVFSTASAVPNHGLDFVTIGDPGNPPTDPAVYHSHFPRPLGGVDYEFRLTRTEVTYAQQLEFLEAYAPYYFADGNPTGGWGEINQAGITGGAPRWSLNPGSENRPGRMSPRLWARYTNWLNNDKANTAEAFNSGAYDASTFGRDENGDLTDQMRRSEGARYWIPSIEEWTKGGYWDPNKNGEGEGGYWLYSNGSDTVPVYGHPDDGGESNAGLGDNPLDVGSYPATQTPWGLLDYSGGGYETVERIGSRAIVLGRQAGAPGLTDTIGHFLYRSHELSLVSLRVASVVPAPGTGAYLLMGLVVWTKSRRRFR